MATCSERQLSRRRQRLSAPRASERAARALPFAMPPSQSASVNRGFAPKEARVNSQWAQATGTVIDGENALVPLRACSQSSFEERALAACKGISFISCARLDSRGLTPLAIDWSPPPGVTTQFADTLSEPRASFAASMATAGCQRFSRLWRSWSGGKHLESGVTLHENCRRHRLVFRLVE